MFDKKTFRLIVSNQGSSKENMATDESLLKNYENNDLPILRLYTWDNDSLTIGISQNIESYDFLENQKEKVAKRITGGGILFHGHDISYSLIIPTDILSTLSIKKSYEYICQFLLNFYKNLGLDVCYAKDNEKIQLSKSEFCQVGFEAYDILVNGKKIGGNAQRRTKKAIFQHGSIPLVATKSNNFDERYGISLEDIEIKLDSKDAINQVIEAFRTTFNVMLKEEKLKNKEIDLKNKLLKEKYDYSNESIK